MAIQKINLGAPVTGAGGEKYRDAHTKINDNFTEVDYRLSGLQSGSTSQGAEIAALKAKDVSQDAAIATKASTSDVNAKNTLQDNVITALQTKDTAQDAAIALRALKTDVDSKNTLQDTAITALQDKDMAQDAAINLRALKSDVDSKNTLQDAAINLRAIKSEVDSKNALQDTAITGARNVADAAIPKTEKGVASGVATLGTDGKVTPTQLPAVTPVAWGSITGNIAAQTDLSDMYFKVSDFNDWAVQISGVIESARKQGDFYATTTAEPSNTYIAPNGDMKRSTATMPVLGTAATKDVGTSAGNVMEVGAFGWGTDSKKGGYVNFAKGASESELKKTQMVSNVDDGALGYGQGVAWSAGQRHYGIVGSLISKKLFVTMLDNNAAAPNSPERGYKEGEFVILGINATRDSNGFLKSNETTGSISVDSIQAGVGAPKIAYKKLTGTTGANGTTTEIAHGLDASKILAVAITISSSTGYYATGNYGASVGSFTNHHTATNIVLSLTSTSNNLVSRPFTALITYEV